jgi:hypothetical protein
MFHVTKSRCFLVYALAPQGTPAAQANRVFNAYIADRRLPLPVFHDHFNGRAGGVAVFFVATAAERGALAENVWLEGWQVDI